MLVDENTINKDIKYEFYDKVICRINDIQQLLDQFDITHINNIKIKLTFHGILNFII